jgi:hypothetical protein
MEAISVYLMDDLFNYIFTENEEEHDRGICSCNSNTGFMCYTGRFLSGSSSFLDFTQDLLNEHDTENVNVRLWDIKGECNLYSIDIELSIAIDKAKSLLFNLLISNCISYIEIFNHNEAEEVTYLLFKNNNVIVERDPFVKKDKVKIYSMN